MPRLAGMFAVANLPEFRDYLNQPYRQPVIYRFFDSCGDLLYIGITSNPYDRWMAHRRKQPWWHEVDAVSFHSVPGLRWELERAEREAIREERPRYNKRSAVRHAA